MEQMLFIETSTQWLKKVEYCTYKNTMKHHQKKKKKGCWEGGGVM